MLGLGRLMLVSGFSLSEFSSVVVATGCCNRSFLSAIAPYTFLRESPLTLTVRGSAVVADADLSTANSSPESPLHSKGRADWLMLAQLTASTVSFELDQPGGISSC